MSTVLTLFAGCYTSGAPASGPQGQGVATLCLDPADGSVRVAGFTPGSPDPSYLALSSDGAVLYAVHEVSSADGTSGGRVSAYRVGEAGTRLTLLGEAASGGAGPCHLSVSRLGLLVSHYACGTVSLLPLGPDGAPWQAVVLGSPGVHAHMAAPGPGGTFVYSADLGADRIRVWRREDSEVRLREVPGCPTAGGAGPRHFAFSARGDRLYLACEKNGTVEAYSVDSRTGALGRFQTVTTVPEGEPRPAGCGAIRLAPSGRFLYVSNRLGIDTVAVFAVDPDSGRLEPRGWYPSGGASPRDLVLDPSGTFLLAANMGSGTVSVLRVDQATGGLSDTGHRAAVPRVTSLVFRDQEPSLPGRTRSRNWA